MSLSCVSDFRFTSLRHTKSTIGDAAGNQVIDRMKSKLDIRKVPCRVIYVLNAPRQSSCGVLEMFDWLSLCNSYDPEAQCGGRYAHLIAISLTSSPGAGATEFDNCPLLFFHCADVPQIPLHHYGLSNASFEVTTKLMFPCGGTGTRSIFPIQNYSYENYALPHDHSLIPK
jgi:hypothetical protein